MNVLVLITVATAFLSPNQSVYVMQDSAFMLFEWSAHMPTLALINVSILDTLE